MSKRIDAIATRRCQELNELFQKAKRQGCRFRRRDFDRLLENTPKGISGFSDLLAWVYDRRFSLSDNGVELHNSVIKDLVYDNNPFLKSLPKAPLYIMPVPLKYE